MEKEDLPARATALTDVLAGEFGYAGDMDTYDDLGERQPDPGDRTAARFAGGAGRDLAARGRAAGWGSHGVDFPAHFLVALEGHKTQVVIDVFNGARSCRRGNCGRC